MMILLFPIIYILSFIWSVIQLLSRKIEGFLLFTVIGLPIYINALSVTFMYGFGGLVPLMQSFKEVITLISCIIILKQIKKRPRLHRIDKLIIIFFLLALAYVFIPLGSYGIGTKLIAFKNLCFFPILYGIGRFCNTIDFHLRKTATYIGIVAIIAVLIVLLEKLIDTHLQSLTGYSDFLFYFFDTEPSGNYGLAWTFETESQMKRFATIFANPLEHAAAIVVLLAVFLTSVTYKKEKRVRLQPDRFEWIVLGASLICIILAASRASFLSYFLLIYIYGWSVGNKSIVNGFHFFFIAIFSYILFLLEGDLYDFVINTITFENASSLGHVIEWIAGIDAMITNPLGMGLGESGRVSMGGGFNTGGENQFIIIGVQIGVIGMLLYLFIYMDLIRTAWKIMKQTEGKIWKMALLIVLLKVGLFIPAFTANIDSYIYITYLTWFLSGYFINLRMQLKQQEKTNDV